MLAPRTAQGRAGLAALRADPAHALVALDYDGTLAPIVVDPAAAIPAAGALSALTAVAGQVGRVAVVTGRPAQVAVDLGGLAGVPGLVVLGQYGVERWAAGTLASPAPAPGIALARTELGRLADAQGARVEDKRLSLVVHTRTAPHGAAERLAGPVAELAARVGLEVHAGRHVLELRPPGFDKRRALLAAAQPRPSAVFYAGDDLGDGAAYDAVAELRLAGVPGLTVFSDSPEGPAAVRDRADVVVAGPAGVVDVLRELLPGSAVLTHIK